MLAPVSSDWNGLFVYNEKCTILRLLDISKKPPFLLFEQNDKFLMKPPFCLKLERIDGEVLLACWNFSFSPGTHKVQFRLTEEMGSAIFESGNKLEYCDRESCVVRCSKGLFDVHTKKWLLYSEKADVDFLKLDLVVYKKATSTNNTAAATRDSLFVTVFEEKKREEPSPPGVLHQDVPKNNFTVDGKFLVMEMKTRKQKAQTDVRSIATVGGEMIYVKKEGETCYLTFNTDNVRQRFEKCNVHYDVNSLIITFPNQFIIHFYR